jgi:hypothetical protein
MPVIIWWLYLHLHMQLVFIITINIGLIPGLGVMVFNATFNNISVISRFNSNRWQCVQIYNFI